jgi:enamine deaminase RidA (YjgF/YER057c/UK114 family)
MNRNTRWLAGRLALSAALLAAAAGCATSPGKDTSAAGPGAEARLAELKIQLPPPNQPSATLRPAVVTGNLIFVSGHISRGAEGKAITGRVGDELTVEQGRAAARQCGLGILATLRHELGNLHRVKRVVKVLGMVNSPPGFKDQPAVINGCSELFLEVFGREAGLGARSAVGVSSLPGNVAVEVEAIFEVQ